MGFKKGIAVSTLIKRGVVGGKMLYECPPQEVMNVVLELKKEHDLIKRKKGKING